MNVWEDQLILKVRAGSHAYGLAGPHSDEDSRGVCLPPKAALTGLQTFEQHEDAKSDNVVYGLPKFIRLALEGNPNLIETLFTDDVLFIDSYGQRLVENREIFLSRRVAERFGHYAISQLKRLENHHRWWAHPPQQPVPPALNAQGKAEFPNQKARLSYEQATKEWNHYQRWLRERNSARAELERQFGYDTKHAMHLCRLLKMGEEILSTGQVLVRRPDAEWLKGVRQGSFGYEELVEWARAREEGLRQMRESSPLPEEPDTVKAEQLLMEIQEAYFWPK